MSSSLLYTLPGRRAPPGAPRWHGRGGLRAERKASSLTNSLLLCKPVVTNTLFD